MAGQERVVEDPNWRKIATLIRDHLDELALSSRERYRRDYKYSSNSHLPDESALRWCRECFLILADELESGFPDAHLYETLGGDMVLQRESMLYQIDAFMEETLFISRFVAELICTTLAGSISLVNELLASLEAFVQWRLRANLSSFSEMVSQPQVLAWAWRLDAQRNEAEKGGTSTLKQGGSLHGLDDDRSLENRLSTLCVKRNVPPTHYVSRETSPRHKRNVPPRVSKKAFQPVILSGAKNPREAFVLFTASRGFFAFGSG